MRILHCVVLAATMTVLFDSRRAWASQAQDTTGKSVDAANSKDGNNVGVDMLSDTQGFDFAPYLRTALKLIFDTWRPLIPEEARAPQYQKSKTAIRFSIRSSGELASMHLDSSTRQMQFDRAAWGAITGVEKFPPLPEKFTKPTLELRVYFYVNAKPPGAQ